MNIQKAMERVKVLAAGFEQSATLRHYAPQIVQEFIADAEALRLLVAEVEKNLPKPAPPDDPNRCAICGWTLAVTAREGCVRGNCSLRPFPKNFYAPERADQEYNGHFSRAAERQAQR
jgi:hypothetical protein